MKRGYLVTYLDLEGCYTEPENGDLFEEGELWHNGENNEVCHIPFDEELDVMTYCHIFYELKVDSPLEYDADYHVYCGFRDKIKTGLNRN